MKNSFLDYSMSVIISRALPDARDGLKPSQRPPALRDVLRPLARPNKKHLKCARIVGETMGKYHPHGDGAIYPTLVNMAQPWSDARHPSSMARGTSDRSKATPPQRCDTPRLA